MTLQAILNSLNDLSDEDLESLYAAVRSRLCACRERRLEDEACAGRDEYAGCGCQATSCDELLREILTCDGDS